MAPPGYFLPVAAGQALIVTNGNMGVLDHAQGSTGQFAWDLSTSGDAPFTVAAVRAGTIIGVESRSMVQCNDLNTLKGGAEGADPKCWAQANYVLIKEDDDANRSDLFMHLAPNSVVVKLGDHVCQGQPLGIDGHTGWADFTHLHFQVEATPAASTTPGWWWAGSQSIAFSDPDVTRQRSDGVPVTYGSYISANSEKAGCSTTAPATPGATPSPVSTPTPRPTPHVTPPAPPTPRLTPRPTPGPTATLVDTPSIRSVTPIIAQADQTITIEGVGFGRQAPYLGDSDYIELADLSGGWNAGWHEPGSPLSDDVTLNVLSWTESKIVIGGFAGSYGSGYTLLVGEQIRVRVWNPQSSKGPAIYLLSVSS